MKKKYCFLFLLFWCFVPACILRNKKGQPVPLPALPPGVYYPAFADSTSPTTAQVNLGRHLFYDRRLSFNQTKSCAGCHAPQFAFTDGYRRSFGATADMHQRNAQPLFNLLFLERFTSANPSTATLQQQMMQPLFNTKFIELGVNGHETEILGRFSSNKEYDAMFHDAFPGKDNTVTIQNIITSITSFMKTITSSNSAYDRYQYHDKKNALSPSALRGMQLFFSDGLQCNTCHSGYDFSGGTVMPGASVNERLYFNTGLYNIDGKGAYPFIDEGLKEFTKQPGDMGKMRVPTLRNLLFTGPYMHDGSVASLSEVIDIYGRGGRLITQGENKGDGSKSPLKDARVKGFRMSTQQKTDLLNFLISLTDSSVLTNPVYQNPFGGDETKGGK
jgi:cytochrome c peroxidase